MRRASSILALAFVTTAALAVEPVNPRIVDRTFEGTRRMVVHAARPLTPADETELATKGVVVGRALGSNRYLARVAQGRQIADPRVASIEPLNIEKKISRTALREAGLGTWAELNVYFHDDVQFERARTALLAAGAAVEPLLLKFGALNRITAKVPPESLSALAANDDVAGITGPIRYRVSSDNARSAELSHVPQVYQAPYGLSGAGVTVSLFELGPAQADHPEFGGRLTVQSTVTGGNASNKLHATHVAGTIAAMGANPDAKGMAPSAKIIQFCVRSGGNTCTSNFLDDKSTELVKVGSGIDNNSWGYVLGWDSEDYPVWNDGDILWGAYWLEITSPFDAISLEENVLFVHSAGNDGTAPFLPEYAQHRHVDAETGDTIKDKLFCYSASGTGTDCPIGAACAGGCETVKHHSITPYDTIGVTAAGKNTIAVGAVQLVAGNLDIAAFSSRGPAKDGRVKPDVVARGYGVLSTTPTNGYGTSQGTSMAAPAVTGIAALLVEQYRKTFSKDPNPVELKALILAGADDIGRAGPDYTFGYGLVNAQASADLIINNAGRGIRSLTVSQTETLELPLVVSAAQPNLRVLLQWGDPAIPLSGNEFIADKALVNDLDLKLVGPDGTTHMPYVLDRVNFEKLATQGVNTVDNTELVEVKNAVPGVYRAVISGAKAAKTQNAVLVTSARTAAPCVDITEAGNNGAGYGDLVPGQAVYAALCSQNDVDTFRWVAMPGAVTVSFTTGDTPVTVEITGGLTSTVNIPANTTQTLTGTVTGSQPKQVTMSVRALNAALGAEPFYRFTPQFTQQTGPRRRSTR